MKVKNFLAGNMWVAIATILALATIPGFASPVDPSSLSAMIDMVSNPFLDLSSWDYKNSALNVEHSPSWTTPIPPVSEDTSSAMPQTFKKRHDYAMVCAQTRGHTEYCQRSPREYYCSQNGYVIQKTTATVRYTPFEEQCVCIGVIPKPICLVGWSGSSTCLRSLPDTDGVELLDTGTLDRISSHDVRVEDSHIIHVSELNTRAAKLRNALDPSVLEALLDIAEAEENDSVE